jgi:hypothetical protein
MAIAEVDLGFNRQAKHYVNEMIIQGVLTDAIIAPMTTTAELRNVAENLPQVSERFYEQYQRRIDNAIACGILTDANVAAANTMAGLLQIFVDNDPTLALYESFSTVA